MRRTLIFAAVTILACSASAQVPALVGFQGYITDLGGAPVTAPEGMTFEVSLYHDAAGGNAFWTDEYTDVQVDGGAFSLLLGAQLNALPTEQLAGGVKYLSLKVDGGAELEPRLQVVSVPYAIRANAADTAVTATTANSISGITADQLALVSDLAGTDGDVTALQNKVTALEAQVVQLQDLFKNPGCVDDCATDSMGCSEDLGSAWTCGDGADEDPCNEKIFSACPGQQKCGAGTCQCLTNFKKVCAGDDAYQQNSCGQLGKLIAKCPEGQCVDGGCVKWSRETPLQLAGMNDLTTVGGDLYAVGDNGQVVHYDGQKWTHMATGTDKNLNAIWGESKGGQTTLFAVGETGKILRYKNGEWDTMTTFQYDTLHDVFGLSENFVMAVGDNGTVLTYNGSKWTRQIWDAEATWQTTAMHAVWALSPQQIWVGGDNGTMIHFEMGEWTKQDLPNGNHVRTLAGVSTQNIWAGTQGDIKKFNGETWGVEPNTAGVNVHGIWIDTAPPNPAQLIVIYAVGDNGAVLKFDSVSWGKQNDPANNLGSGAHFRGVQGGPGSPSQGVWLVANDGRVAYQNLDENWIFPALTQQVRAFYAVAGDLSSQWAVGSDCLAMRVVDGEWLKVSIDGAQCAGGSGGDDFLAMWGDGTNANIFAVGENGLFKKWDGTAWIDELGPNGNTNRDILGFNDGSMFVVQNGGAFLFDGLAWQHTGDGDGVSGWGTSTTDFHTVSGQDGSVRSFDGSEWSSTTLTSENLRDIWGVTSGDMWTVGDGGKAFHYNGTEWTDESVPENVFGESGGDLNAVWTTTPVPVYVAGQNGHTYIRDGGVWTNERTFPNKNHFIVYGSNAANVLLGGDGTIYRRTD